MPYRHTSVRIHEFIQKPKVLCPGESAKGKKKGAHGLEFAANVEFTDSEFLDMTFRGKATHSLDPTTYDGNFFVEQQRVRGVGHNFIRRDNLRSKLRIPAGWHQNIVDPQKATHDPAYNRHEPLPDFHPTDFEDFTRKLAEMWTIDLLWESTLL